MAKTAVRRPPDNGDAARRKEFAKRVLAARVKKGWNQSELARQAAKHMPDGKFGRDNISKYESASTMPTPVYAVALARSLNLAIEDLIPGGGLSIEMELEPSVAMRQVGASRAFLRINQEVDLATAYKIMGLLGKINAPEL